MGAADAGSNGLEMEWSVATFAAFATVVAGARDPTTKSFDTSSAKECDSGISLQTSASARGIKTKTYKPCGNRMALPTSLLPGKFAVLAV